MSLLPMAIVDALAGKIVRSLTTPLQAAIRELADHSPASQFKMPSLFNRSSSQIGGGSSDNRSSSPAKSKLPTASHSKERPRDTTPKLSERLSKIVNPPMERSVVNKFIAAAEKRSSIDQAKSGQSFWKRGWGTLANGVKRSTASRAARLTTIAAKRLSSAKRAVSASNKNRNSPGWHPAAHGALLANKNLAAQKLAQATALQAKSTIFGAISSGRVASGLSNLASKIPMLASRIAIPTAIITAAARAPFTLSKMNDALIKSQLDVGYTKRRQDSISAYETKNQNIRTLNARDTESSFEFLVNQQDRLKSTLRPFQAAIANAANYTQGGASWVATKFFEGWQLELDAAAAAKKTADDAFQGILSDPITNFKNIRADREKKRSADEKVQSQQFTDIFGAFAKGSLSDQQMNLDNARFNNITVPPLRPIR